MFNASKRLNAKDTLVKEVLGDNPEQPIMEALQSEGVVVSEDTIHAFHTAVSLLSSYESIKNSRYAFLYKETEQYRVQLNWSGRRHTIGYFDTITEANAAAEGAKAAFAAADIELDYVNHKYQSLRPQMTTAA